MYNLIFGFALVSLALGFLFFLLKQKEKYFEYYPQSWRILLLGGVLLTLGGGANLFSIINRSTLRISIWRQQAVQAVEALSYLAGGGLTLIGFWKWCGSLIEVRKNATRRLRQLTCLNSLLSVINHRQELDETFKESLTHILSLMGYKMGVIFKPTFNSSEMTVIAHGGVPVGNLFALFDLYSKNVWYKESNKSKEVTTTTDVKSLPEYGTLFSEQEQI